jgi:hypothetical protein
MYRKIVATTSAIALAGAITVAQPAPKAEAFIFLAPLALAGIVGGSVLFGSLLGTAGSASNSVAGHSGCRTKSGSTYNPATGAFTGEWATQTTCAR